MQDSNQMSANQPDQSNQSGTGGWLVILLSVLLVISVGANIVQTIPSPNTESSTRPIGDLNKLNSTATFGDITWTGRVVDNGKKDDEGGPIESYELIRTDAEGGESIMYQTDLGSFFPSINWSSRSYPTGNEFVFEEVEGAGEGGWTTAIGYKDGEEIVRSSYGNYGPYVQNFTFKARNFPAYEVTLKTSGTCKLSEDDLQKRDYILEGAKTAVLGVTITSKDDSRTFTLPEPETVPCAVIDGGTTDPTILAEDIKTDASGISFALPGTFRASIPVFYDTKEIEVSFSTW